MARYCLRCGYNLAGLSGHRCPECGQGFDPADPSSFRCGSPRRRTSFVLRPVLTAGCVAGGFVLGLIICDLLSGGRSRLVMLTVPLSVFAAVTLLSVVISIRLQEGLLGFAILHVPMLLIISRISGLEIFHEFNLEWAVLIDAFVGPAMLLGLGAGYLIARIARSRLLAVRNAHGWNG